MSYTTKQLPKSAMELTFVVTPAEYEKDLQNAAQRLSERAAIRGFRPGKAPFEMVKKELGEAKILEEALSDIVQHNYFAAVKAEKLETIGAPEVHLSKIAPNNDLEFTAKVALMPKVTLPDWSKIKVENKLETIGEEKVNEVLESLRKMQTKENKKDGAATKEDKVVVDMQMSINKVPVEGGQSKAHQVYLSEAHYIPGFAEQLVGLSAGESKQFSLKFPAEHYQKHLAGKMVDFDVTVTDVLGLSLPEIDAAFAKTLGQKSVQELKDLLHKNLTAEAAQKETQRAEAEMLEAAIKAATFSDIPDILIETEKQRLFAELKRNLEKHNISMEQYLKDMKKTEKEIADDFIVQAEERAKAALLSRAVAVEFDIKVADAELKTEIENIKQAFKDNPQALENLERPEVIDTIATTIQNRKVVEWMTKKIKLTA